MGRILAGALDIVNPQARNKGLALNMTLCPDFPIYVRGDQQRLRQVLLNLLYNAVKFTIKGGITLSVDKLVEEADDAEMAGYHFVSISVADTGAPGSRGGAGQQWTRRLLRAERPVHRHWHRGGGTGQAVRHVHQDPGQPRAQPARRRTRARHLQAGARAPPPGAERVEARQTRPVETHDATPAHSLAAVRTHTSATIPSLNPAACRSPTAPVRHSSSS